MKIYCARCKTKKKTMSDEEVYVTKAHRVVIGRCSGCGRKIYKIITTRKK